MLLFAGVNIGNFNSILRRALVWKPKARFLLKKYLERYPEHEKAGIFEADPSLNNFLSSSQASLAGLRLQHAFELTRNKDACYQLIEEYVNGGDEYLTEDTMRLACSLPVRRKADDVDAGLGNLMAGADSQDDAEQHEAQWRNLVCAIFQKMLDSQMETLSFPDFKKMTFTGDVPNLPKNILWDELQTKSLMMKATVRRVVGRVGKDKDRQGYLIPVLTTKQQLPDVIDTKMSQKLLFKEHHDLNSLTKYMDEHASRAKNVDVMMTYFQEALKGKLKKGKPDADTLAKKQQLEKKFNKMKDYESALVFFRSLTTPSRGAKRRRIITKQESTPVEYDDGSGLHSMDIHYHYPEHNSVRSRRYTSKGGAQAAPRRVQHRCLHHTQDLDIHNCCLCILKQLLDKMAPDPGLPQELQTLLLQCVNTRDSFIRDFLKVPVPEGKCIIGSILNGGLPPTGLQKEPIILQLQSMGIYFRWLACNMLPEDLARFADDKDRRKPLASTLHLMWTAVEDAILEAWLNLLCPLSPKHISLHFDGLRADRNFVSAYPNLITTCENAILEKTGFAVRIMKKETKTIARLIVDAAETTVSLRAVPDALLQGGNCIPCALWHLDSKLRTIIAKVFETTEGEENKQALEKRCRSYRACAAALKIDLACSVGLPANEVMNFILHFENDGKPHAVTVQYSASREHVSVLDGSMHYRLSSNAFVAAVQSGVDESTAVSFWVAAQSRQSKQTYENILLDLEAGMDSSLSEGESVDAEEVGQGVQRDMVLDGDEELAFPDAILDHLKEEVAQYKIQLESKTNIKKLNGRYVCELCPFRSFKELRALKVHVQKHHSRKNQFVCSGTKQIKAIAALHDHHAGLQESCKFYLRATARVMSSTIAPALSVTKNHIDKDIRLLYSSSGPKYVNYEALKEEIVARRVRNVYYDKSFAEALLQEVLMQRIQAGRVCSVMRYM